MSSLLVHTPEFVEAPTNSSNVSLPRHSVIVSGADSFIELFTSLLSYKVTPHTALSRCAELCCEKRLRTAAEKLVEEIEGGALLSQAMAKQQEFFGDLLITFVTLGEAGYGLCKSLQRYLSMQEQRQRNDQLPSPLATTRNTRDFALVTGTLMDLGVSVPDALTLAALDKPGRFRRSIERSVKEITAGEEVSDALEEKSRVNIFRFGFDHLFLNTVRLGENTNSLGRMLVDFGSKTWSLQRL